MKNIIFFLFLFSFIESKCQVITTFAGTGTIGCNGATGLAITKNITDPLGMVFDSYGNYYFCNQQCNTVCKVDTNGFYSVIAGPGIFSVIGDGGPATAAFLNYPNDIAFDTFGNLFIVDAQNYRVRKVDMTTNIISTVVGTGVIGYGGDGGSATLALINSTNGIFFDRKNNLFISDCGNNRVRKVNSMGIISTIAGNGIPGFSGDNGPATNANLNNPFDVIVDKLGNVFFPDALNKRIRKVDTSGIITTIAGTGIGIYNGDGILATSANFGPYKIAMDNNGNIFASDSNSRIRKIDTLGIIHTIAGTGVSGYNGDGIPATVAQINEPSGITTDICGNVYFGDVGNNRIRRIPQQPIITFPIISISGPISERPGNLVTITATISNAGSSYLIEWMNHGIEFTTTTVPSVTYTKMAGIDTITANIVPTGYGCWDSTTSSAHVVVDGSLDLHGYSTNNSYNLFPNPAHNSLTITGNEKHITICVLDILGQEVLKNKTDNGSSEINISNLIPGIYMVKINGFVCQRFIKE